MAIATRAFHSPMRRLVEHLQTQILSKSISASLEHEFFYQHADVEVWQGTFERFSWIGGNRLSAHVVVTGYQGDVHLTVSTAGGSQALFFKINTFGEERFLNEIMDGIDRYIQAEGASSV